MKAYSLRDKDVGYCQGSGFIVGLLLMHVRIHCSLVMCHCQKFKGYREGDDACVVLSLLL